MRLIRENEAEAVFEPYWDGSSSENPTDKTSLLSHYKIIKSDENTVRIKQEWCAATISFDCLSGKTFLEMERECGIDISNYDTLRIFGALPACTETTIELVVDGISHIAANKYIGNDTTCENDFDISGKFLDSIRLYFELKENRPTSVVLHWLGLSNKIKEKALEGETNFYTKDWVDLMKDDGSFEPETGLYFDSKELENIRSKVLNGYLKDVYLALKKAAENDLFSEPEKDIGRYIPRPDRRWCRTRDMKKICTAGIMERLAFVGLVEKNSEMMKMAVRMALCAAHYEYWCESLMGVFPGATWHHRSFTEEIYCRSCALVLDWCGGFITACGKQIIRDAIIMKGLPRIESDFKRMEYIRHMNQGIVFSSGRIFGLLSLIPAYPRYEAQLLAAENDLHEMIENYVMPDGGVLEGPGYWSYTFSHAIPIFYVLSRFHKKTFSEYATKTLINSGAFALGIMSIIGSGINYLGINDAHSGVFPADLIAAYYKLTDNEEFKKLFGAIVKKNASGGINLLVMSPDASDFNDNYIKYGFYSLPETGHIRIVRDLKENLPVNFHFVSGAAYGGHYHEDKGSFIIETNKSSIVCDRGVTTYSHPETGVIKNAYYHNLLYPETANGAIVHQLGNGFGRILKAVYENGVLEIISDNKEAWQKGVFEKNIRRVISNNAGEYIIEDEIILCSEGKVSFILNTLLEAQKEKNGVTIKGEDASLYAFPLNWTPEEIKIVREGVNENLKEVNLIKLTSKSQKEFKLITEIKLITKTE